MKKLITLIAIFLAVGLLIPDAQAGHSQRRVVGYNQCGDPVYATYTIVSYQRCGTPNYGWVRDSCNSGCTRPGRCNAHGHSHSRYQSSGYSNSRLQVRYVTPRSNYRSNSYSNYRSSRSSRGSSCR